MNYTNLEMQAPNALLEICLDERRMELAGETNHRWFDVRRCGITYQHTKFAHIGEEISQTLTEDMYELPIPQSAIRLNGLLGISNVIVVVE